MFRSKVALTAHDYVGTGHPSLEAAKKQAIKRIRQLLNEEAASGHKGANSRSIEITDETGSVVAIVPFSAAG